LFDLDFLINIEVLKNIGAMLAVAWIPIWFVHLINTCLYPSEIDKLAKADAERQQYQISDEVYQDWNLDNSILTNDNTDRLDVSDTGRNNVDFKYEDQEINLNKDQI